MKSEGIGSFLLELHSPGDEISHIYSQPSYNNEISVWRVNNQKVVVKKFLKGSIFTPVQRAIREAEGLQCCSEIEIAPKYMGSLIDPETPIVVMSLEYGDDYKSDVELATRTMATYLATLHKLQIREGARERDIYVGLRNLSEFEFWIESFNRKIEVGGHHIPADLQPHLQDRIELTKLYKTFLHHYGETITDRVQTYSHGDAGLQNLLNGERGILLDWEYFGLRDPTYEAASVLWFPQILEQRARLLPILKGHYFNGTDSTTDNTLAKRFDVWDALIPFRWFLKSLSYFAQVPSNNPIRNAVRDEARKRVEIYKQFAFSAFAGH